MVEKTINVSPAELTEFRSSFSINSITKTKISARLKADSQRAERRASTRIRTFAVRMRPESSKALGQCRNTRHTAPKDKTQVVVMHKLLEKTMQMTIVVLFLLRLDLWLAVTVQAVSVQRLQVPDLVVIDQQQGPNRPTYLSRPNALTMTTADSSNSNRSFSHGTDQRHWDGTPQAASLVNIQPPDGLQQQQQISFECLVSFDRKRDKNLIIKWHHDERNEPIYQWIPELNKRSIAPQYRAFIAPITSNAPDLSSYNSNQQLNFNQTSAGSNQQQLLEAGFKLIRPTKELGGKYTCSAISSQNDDSKSKKVIVYTPPKSFRFNVTRADIGAMLASQRDRLIQLTQPAQQQPFSTTNQQQVGLNQLPLAYRMRGLVEPSQTSQQQQQLMTMAMNGQIATTISPQMYSTIDYVNVNRQQRTRQQLLMAAAAAAASNQNSRPPQSPNVAARQQLGLKLVCDIDQVFPVPEISIYRLGKWPDSTQPPEKLAKLDTRIERDVSTGLFHVQVTSILDEEELQAIRHGLPSSAPPGDIHFECVIALTNLELSKYADNKRGVIYRPGRFLPQQLTNGALQADDNELDSSSTGISSAASLSSFATTSWLQMVVVVACGAMLPLLI